MIHGYINVNLPIEWDTVEEVVPGSLVKGKSIKCELGSSPSKPGEDSLV